MCERCVTIECNDARTDQQHVLISPSSSECLGQSRAPMLETTQSYTQILQDPPVVQYHFVESDHLLQSGATEAQADKVKRAYEERLRKRKERNRIAARDCRRRQKRERDQILQQIGALEEENNRLRVEMQLRKGDGESSEERARTVLFEELQMLLENGGSDHEIRKAFEKFDFESPVSKTNTRIKVTHYYQSLQRLMMPKQSSLALMTLLTTGWTKKQQQQKIPATNQDSDDGKTRHKRTDCGILDLYNYIADYIEISPEQEALLRDTDICMQDVHDYHVEKNELMEELRDAFTEVHRGLNEAHEAVERTLSPNQWAKFVTWVSRNELTLQIFKQLWAHDFPTETGCQHCPYEVCS